MLTRLPDRIDPFRMVRRAERLRGWVALARMSRLCASLESSDGHVAVDLRFDRDAGGLSRMTGTAEAMLVMSCQRCLNPMALGVRAEVNVALLIPGERVNLPAGQESMEVARGLMSLTQMVEDELILSLPITPMHDERECRGVQHRDTSPGMAQESANPFAVLASFKPRG